jgi:pyruvate-ferredoxin/flavodoxin oxidoreductase
MGYGHVYVAQVAFGAKDNQTVSAFLEADAYPGPSLIIAYSHCIAHGYDMAYGCDVQKLAVNSAAWPLYRFDPRKFASGEPPLHLDSGPPTARIEEYVRNQARFRMVEKADPKRFQQLMAAAQRQAARHFAVYQQLAEVKVPVQTGAESKADTEPAARR